MNFDSVFSIAGIPIIVLPDDDEKFHNMPLNSIVTNGYRMMVRESEWPKLREILIAATKEKP